MSGERIIEADQVKTQSNVDVASKSPPKISKRVDINTLLNKVRANQKKEKLESTIFFSLVAAIIVVTGIIISI